MRRPLNLWLLLLLAVCAVSVWAGSRGGLPFLAGGPGTGEQKAAPAGATGTGFTENRTDSDPIHLAVLNGTGQSGLARRVGLLVPRTGCVAEQIGNAPEGQHPRSLLINRRLPRARAELLARRLGGLRLLTEWDGRRTEDAVLLLGDDHERVLAALED